MPSNKSFRTKQKLSKAQKQNRAIPHWFHAKQETKKRYNLKSRKWFRTKLNL